MNGLSMHRVRLLLRNHVVSEYRSMLTPFAAIAILILLQSLVTDSYAERSSGMYDGWFGAVLLFWGVIVASRAFREMHDKTTNEAWFLLPASSAEKTLARALHVSVTFVLMQLAFFTLLAMKKEAHHIAFVFALALSRKVRKKPLAGARGSRIDGEIKCHAHAQK